MFGVALVAAAPVVAQVYKCVDRSGHTTYQQSPCTRSQQGGEVELKDPVSTRPGANETQWSSAAREQRVVVGMPKPFVTEALGAPSEIRAPRQGETGTEVWVFIKPAGTSRYGFLNNVVAWIRTDAADVPRQAGTTDKTVAREARVRNALNVGKSCTEVLHDAGAPDREEPLVAGSLTGTRYVYAFDAANQNAFAAFVCLNGRVTSVERFVPESAPQKN